jgi:hypothetical protein
VRGRTGAYEIYSQLVTVLNKYELLWEKMVVCGYDWQK